MYARDTAEALSALFSELVEGAPATGAFVLNQGDGGLLRSLEKLSAAEASAASHGGASIAAHVRHLQYGLSLMNRWTAGENPFANADWAAAWRTTAVSDAEWTEARHALRAEAEKWLAALRAPRDVAMIELSGMIGSVAHLAYHLGAIRQIAASARGPRETG